MKTLAAIHFFIQSRKALRLKPRTITWYTHKLAGFAQAYPDLPEDPSQIEQFLANINGDQNAHAYYRTLKAFYRFLKKRYQMPNPIELIDLHRPINIYKPTLEPDEMFRLLSSATTLRDKAILTLLMDTGMRASELAGLKKQHILTEEVAVFGKTGWRNIPISEDTKRLLLAVITQDGADEYVFHGKRGPITRKGVYNTVNKYMKKAGIDKPKMGPHRIRHAFAKTYLMNGGDLRSLQEIMGHASIRTTEEYLRYAGKGVIGKHHMYTPLLAIRAAAQGSFVEKPEVTSIKEAEAILERKSKCVDS